jgi:putative hydrolase of the HAD superfamily
MKSLIYLSAFLCFLFITSPTLAVHQERPKPILVFDFGGVVGEADNELLFLHLERELHLSRQQVLQVIAQLRDSQTKGISEEEFWKEYAASIQTVFSENWMQTLDTVKQSAVRANPRMIELVKKLKSLGYRTALLSNVQKHQAKIVRDKGLYLYFDPLVLSCEIGVEKPKIEAYQILLQRLKARPQECIMIDDSMENIQAVHQLGMDGILFQTVEGLVIELKKRNIPEEPRNGVEVRFSFR